jgi:hypothetical protein
VGGVPGILFRESGGALAVLNHLAVRFDFLGQLALVAALPQQVLNEAD